MNFLLLKNTNLKNLIYSRMNKEQSNKLAKPLEI